MLLRNLLSLPRLMFSRLNATMASVVQAIDQQEQEQQSNQSPGNQSGSNVGVIGPLFNPQYTSSPTARTTTKSVGAKPTRTFVWLGSNVSDVDLTSLNEKKIKFEKSMNAGAMVTLLKREFTEITASTVSYYKCKSAGNHALYHVGNALSGDEIAKHYKSSTTRVFVADIQAVPAVSTFPALPAVAAVAAVPAAVVNVTTTTNTSADHLNDKTKKCIKGHFGPQYHETSGCPVGVIAPDFSDNGLYHPGLLHDSRLQVINTALRDSRSSGLPFVGITFECLCHHINSGPRMALVILTNNAKHLRRGETEMLGVLCELYCNEKMACDPDPLIWIQSRDSLDGMEAIQTFGNQSAGYPQLVVCTPSLRGVKAPMTVERFSEDFLIEDFLGAIAKAKDAILIVQANRTKRNEDLALKRQQEEEYMISSKADALKYCVREERINRMQSTSTNEIETISIDVDEHETHVPGCNTEADKIHVRQVRTRRVTPEDPHGVKVKVHSPLGLLERRFKINGFYQEVYDWLGSNKDLPLYFVLVHQKQSGVEVRYPKENLPQHGEVLKLIEKDEKEMKSIMSEEEVSTPEYLQVEAQP